jgi:hypothetical protein
LAGTAAIYGFGYLWCMPDVLGGTARDQSRTLRQRWSDFALLSTFLAVVVIVFAYIWTIRENYSYVSLPFALALVMASCWLLAACVVASEKYLSWTLPGGEGKASTGWRAGIRTATRTWGNWLIRALGVRRAIVIGSALALLSLIVSVQGEVFTSGSKGYEIVAGRAAWAAVEDFGDSGPALLLVQVHRGFYILGLAVAVVALAGVMTGRLGRIIRRYRILAVLAGAVALFEITPVALATQILQEMSGIGRLGWAVPVAILPWVVPISLWIVGARTSRPNWDHTRVSIMIFYLPIFFLSFAFLVVLTYFALGLGCFIFGMLIVWWGVVQRQREIASQEVPSAL